MKKIQLKLKNKSWLIYNDFYDIPQNISLKTLENKNPLLLQEDALLIRSPHYVIDAGYYNLLFRGLIVKDQNYDAPIERVSFKTVQEAKKWINTWVKKVEKLEKKNKNET